jgi:hypothetical protein
MATAPSSSSIGSRRAALPDATGRASRVRLRRASAVAVNDAPLIDERGATRGRGAMECGGERADHPFALQPRSPDRAAGTGPMAAKLPTEARACKRSWHVSDRKTLR